MEPRIRDVPFKGQPGTAHHYFCPGCGKLHAFWTEQVKGPNWTWNKDYLKPTVSPSINCKMGKDGKEICHHFIKDGEIRFLTDCTHKLAGQTVALPGLDADWEVTP